MMGDMSGSDRGRVRELGEDDLRFWLDWLEELGPDRIRALDFELCRDIGEAEEMGLSALPALEAARIMRVAELNLRPRETVDRNAPTAYGLKHDFERWVELEEGRCYYVSELQASVVMCLLGYRRTPCRPRRYNVSMRSYNRMRDRIRAMAAGGSRW